MALADVKAKVALKVRESLQAGRIAPGQRLPTERALAAELKCDRRTARAALDLLESEGLIRRLSPHVRIAAYPVERSPAVFMRNSVLLVTEPDTRENSGDDAACIKEVDLGVMDAAQSEGLHVLTYHRARLDLSELASVLALRPRGVLVTEPGLQGGAAMRLIQPLSQKFGVPLVTCSDAPGCTAVDRVVSDHEAGGRLLCGWLASRGCRRIMEVGVSSNSAFWVAARTRGYLRGCSELGMDPLPRMLVPGVFWVGRGISEFERAVRFFAGYLAQWLMPGRVDAVMAQNDIDALLVLEACRVLGISEREWPTVTGYDNLVKHHPIRKWSELRPAATVEKHNSEQGRGMLALALERSGGSLARGCVRRLIAPDIVETANEG